MNVKCEDCVRDDPPDADFFLNGSLFKACVEVRSLPNFTDERCARLPVFYAGRVPFMYRDKDVPMVARENPQSNFYYVLEKTTLQGFVTNHRFYTHVFRAGEAQVPHTKLIHDEAEYVYVPWDMLRRAAAYVVPLMYAPPPSSYSDDDDDDDVEEGEEDKRATTTAAAAAPEPSGNAAAGPRFASEDEEGGTVA